MLSYNNDMDINALQLDTINQSTDINLICCQQNNSNQSIFNIHTETETDDPINYHSVYRKQC